MTEVILALRRAEDAFREAHKAVFEARRLYHWHVHTRNQAAIFDGAAEDAIENAASFRDISDKIARGQE